MLVLFSPSAWPPCRIGIVVTRQQFTGVFGLKTRKLNVERRFFAVKCCGLTRTIRVSPEFRDLLDGLHGVQMFSGYYAAIVMIRGATVTRAGEILDILDSDEKIELIWQESLFYAEEVAREQAG